VTVSPVLPHLLAWLDTDDGTGAKWGTTRTDDWLDGWKACEKAGSLPTAFLSSTEHVVAQIRTVKRPSAASETAGSRVSRLRSVLGWTQESLAFEAEVNQATISLLEQDERVPLSDTLQKIAQALGVTMDFLWTGQPHCEHDDGALVLLVTRDGRGREEAV